MKTILLLLCGISIAQADVLRLSKVSELPGPNTEQITFQRGGGLLGIYHVQKDAIVTEKDVKSAEVVKEPAGTISVTLTKDGAKKLAAATKGAAGKLRLAILVNGVLVSAPLVQAELGDTFWVTGLASMDAADLEKLARSLGE